MQLQGALAEVQAVQSKQEHAFVYNFEVAANHDYFVSNRGVLVHNACATYSALRKLIKGTGLHAHHLIEKRFAAALGVKASQMLSIAVTAAEHQVFTNAWRSKVAYGTDYAEMGIDAIYNAARVVYQDYPEILRALGL